MSDEETEGSTESKENAHTVPGVPCGCSASFATSTEREECIKQLSKTLLIDAHMHVMSLNCTPMPLQWGTAYLEAGGFGEKVGQGRSEVTQLLAGRSLTGWVVSRATKDLGKIGQFSTNLIADIYMGAAKKEDMEAHLHWLLKYWILPQAEAFETDAERIDAGDTLKIAELAKNKSNLASFNTITQEYYTDGAPARMNIAMPMDLSYAHYWGLHDLPIYLPVLGGKTFYMINDFFYVRNGVLDIEYEPLKFKNADNQKILFYSTDILSSHAQTRIDFLGKLEKTEIEEEDKKPYKHYLMKIEGDSTEMFEDYWKQAALHEGAALRYPLEIVPFFHYDPRRYYLAGDETKDAILDALAGEDKAKHAFFDITETLQPVIIEDTFTGYYLPPQYESVISLHDFSPEGETMTTREYFNTIFFKGYYKKAVVEPNPPENLSSDPCKKTHEECVKEYLYPDGTFLGVKLYPPLGYPADLASTIQQNRFDYPKGRFDNYNALFKHCIEHTIPITAHASPHGMSVADGHNYFLRDTQDTTLNTADYPIKQVTVKSIVKDKNLASFTNILKGEKVERKDYTHYVDEIMTHPMHWKRLLKPDPKSTSEFENLTLCLAHFSGMEAWDGSLSTKDAIRKDWIDDVIELINLCPNVYTDISYYAIEPIPNEYRWEPKGAPMAEDEQEKLAKKMADKIKDNPNLRWRILMGSDWYMFERNRSGVSEYYKHMFTFLTKVTRLVGQEWDAWHQFSVINPLLFLGFLQLKDRKAMEADPEKDTLKEPESIDCNGKSYYTADYTRLTEMHEKLVKKARTEATVEVAKGLTAEKWKKLAGISLEDDEIDDLEDERTTNDKKLPKKIYTADSIKTENGNSLLILENEKNFYHSEWLKWSLT